MSKPSDSESQDTIVKSDNSMAKLMNDSMPMSKPVEEESLYVFRKGNFEDIPAMRRKACAGYGLQKTLFQIAMTIGRRRMRKELHGYKPDVSLVVSALFLSHTVIQDQ